MTTGPWTGKIILDLSVCWAARAAAAAVALNIIRGPGFKSPQVVKDFKFSFIKSLDALVMKRSILKVFMTNARMLSR